MSKEKIETIEKRFLNYKCDRYEVKGAFSHQKRNYITIDVIDSDGNPYTICDKSDSLYDKIEKIKVQVMHKDIK